MNAKIVTMNLKITIAGKDEKEGSYSLSIPISKDRLEWVADNTFQSELQTVLSNARRDYFEKNKTK